LQPFLLLTVLVVSLEAAAKINSVMRVNVEKLRLLMEVAR
jgi:hypothetical protein